MLCPTRLSSLRYLNTFTIGTTNCPDMHVFFGRVEVVSANRDYSRHSGQVVMVMEGLNMFKNEGVDP